MEATSDNVFMESPSKPELKLSDLMEKCKISASPFEDFIEAGSLPLVDLPFDKKSAMKMDPKRKPNSVKLARAFDKLASVLPELQSEKFKRMDAVCKEVFRTLQHRSQFKVRRYVLSKFEPKCVMVIDPPKASLQTVHGTLAGTTLSVILNDFEMCLKSCLANEQPFTDQNNNSQSQLELFCLSKTNRFTLQFICNGLQLEIIPALNFVGDVLSRITREEFLQEQQQGVLAIPTRMKDESSAIDEYQQLLENSLLEIHFDALSQQSEFIQTMLHIVKLWESVSIWLDGGANPLPLSNDELMDIILINAAQREEDAHLSISSEENLEDVGGAAALVPKETKEKPSYLRAFRKYLVSLQLFPNLRININKSQKTLASEGGSVDVAGASDHDKQDQKLPNVIGFSNPYKNLANVTESYMLSKFAHSTVTLGFSYGDYDAFAKVPENAFAENLNFNSMMDTTIICPNTGGLELFCVIVPYILINEVPEYVTALDKVVQEIGRAGLGLPDLQLTDYCDLTGYIKKAIESGKLTLPAGSEIPTSLEKIFKLFDLCDPPVNLQPLLDEFKKSALVEQVTGPEELFNQLVLYEYIHSMEPFPKSGAISIENNESLQWMKSFGCKNNGFNIRSVVFEDNPIAFQFLRTLAVNVELMVHSYAIGEMARGKSLESASMLKHLENHVLTFLNVSYSFISFVDWNRQVADSPVSGRRDGKKKNKPKNSSTMNGGDKCDHKNFDVTYIVPYTIFVDDEPAEGQQTDALQGEDEEDKKKATAINYAVVSLNW